MEESLGRFLHPGEIVHHEDGNKENNSLSNLLLFASQADHQRHHRRNEKRYSADLADAIRPYAADPRKRYVDASNDLKASVEVIRECCRHFGIEWVKAARQGIDEQSVREALQGRTTEEAARLLGVTHHALRARFDHLLKKRVSRGFLDAHKEEIRSLAMSQTLKKIAEKFGTSATVVHGYLVRWSGQDGSMDALDALQARRRNTPKQIRIPYYTVKSCP
jgi:hypothetical protein